MENNFMDNLANHAKRGLVISWAIKGQWGFMHFNNQDNS
jgi:hypothetical protein